MLTIAGVLIIVIALIHSVLGEMVIFGAARRAAIVPNQAQGQWSIAHIRIIWCSWHIVTLMSIALGVTLIFHSIDGFKLMVDYSLWAWVTALVSTSLLVLIGTRAKHPSWIALLVIAALLVYELV